MEKVDLSIIILSFNTKVLTLNCINSILEFTRGIDYEIIVVDNNSKDGSVEEIEVLSSQNKNLFVIKNTENIGFSRANNQGAEVARGRYFLFLNSDTRLMDNVLGETTLWMDKHPEAGAVCCKLVGKYGETQETGGYFPTLLRIFSWMIIQDIPGVDLLIKPFHPLKKRAGITGKSFFDSQRELDWIVGAFFFTRKEVFEKVNGWNSSYFMYVEDVDLSFRIKREGYKIFYLPRWKIIHYGGASSKIREYPLLSEIKGIKIFYKLHYPTWQFPILRVLLKTGALGRMLLFGILEGKESVDIYAKAFRLV